MTQDLVSSAPGIYQAFLSLVQTAAAAWTPTSQVPTVQVFPFIPGQYEPGAYVTLSGIENHVFEWETLGGYSQVETYDVAGLVTIYVGDTVTDGTVPTDVLSQAYTLFNTVVMTPVMTNRNIPILNTSGPSPYLVLPNFARYQAQPGGVGGQPAGWVGVMEWSFQFKAFITPG